MSRSAPSRRPPVAQATQLATLERALTRAYPRLAGSARRLLLAVSGGADSTALLRATRAIAPALGLDVVVGVVDHGLRAESAAEAEAVLALARTLDVPAHRMTLSLRSGSGLEARARTARYSALEAKRVELGLDWVVTAHTATDQAETLLMRLARGSALRGAGGVRARRERILRPLLDSTRDDVLAYLAERGQRFHDDAMNRDPVFLRTRVRADALPALTRAAGHDVARKLAGFARLAAEDDAFLSGLAETARTRLTLADGTLDSVGLRALAGPMRRRVVAGFFGAHGIPVDLHGVEGALALLEGGPSRPVGRDHTLRLRNGRLLLSANPPRRATRRAP